MEKQIIISNCNICGSKAEKVIQIRFKDLIGFKSDYIQEISICDNCGFIFVANPFNEEQLENRYTNLSKYEGGFSIERFEENLEYIKRSKYQFSFIDSNICDFKSVLDIGASTGYNLSLYKEAGYEVFGIEPSKGNKETAKMVYGVELYSGMFDAYINEYSNKKYDLVFLSNILEHIVNPKNFMEKVSLICNKYIFIEVPVFECKYVDEPLGHFTDEHINYFTLESLSNLMTLLGYEPIQFNLNYYLHTYVPSGNPAIMTLWEKSGRTRHNFKPIMKSRQYLSNYINYNTARYEEIKVKIDEIDDNVKLAVWGAGNHTSKLLAMTNLSKKNIIKFYDNDQKKHSYKMNQKPIEKFNIEDINSGVVEKILISTYTACKAILDELKQYGIDDKIILLYNE